MALWLGRRLSSEASSHPQGPHRRQRKKTIGIVGRYGEMTGSTGQYVKPRPPIKRPYSAPRTSPPKVGGRLRTLRLTFTVAYGAKTGSRTA
jgi:hypothetical protein